MKKRILLIQGHPDANARHFGHQLEDAYAEGAEALDHEVRRIQVAKLDFPLLRSQHDWEHGELPTSLAESQELIEWCNHLVLFFPLWMGDMPALLKAYLEQVARPGFAFGVRGTADFGAKRLSGRSARVVVTMGMPAILYRWYYRAHSVKSLERNILGFVGFAPINETLVGKVAAIDHASAEKWIEKLATLGGLAE
jgi:putative NADPH-quinone reductase